MTVAERRGALATAAPEETSVAAPTALLEISRLNRSFGETKALSSASLVVRPGEVHALAGENGSGKSTLIKVLSGVLRPDGGEIRWLGSVRRFTTPFGAQSAGISTVFQETLVIPELSVQDNLFVGTERIFRHRRSAAEEQAEAERVLGLLGLGHVSLKRLAWTLSLADQQLVTIARSLTRPWKLLVLDEGTSALDSRQRDRLFSLLSSYRAEGRSVLFTSHRMEEVRQLADTVSVLRLGETVACLPVGETNAREILSLMAGRESAERALGEDDAEARPSSAHQRAVGAPVLKVEQVVLQEGARPIDLCLEKGEILGLAGLEGQGQERLSDALCGLYSPRSGAITVADDAGVWAPLRSFREASRRGVAYVPRDRKREGLFFALSILDNFSMALMRSFNRGGVLRRRALRREFQLYAERLRLKAGAPTDLIGMLSGGNQQKVLLARWLATHPKVLVLNDPLRGVDANTKEELYSLFRDLSAEGLTIVLLSTEILELLLVCDRIAVFHDGGLQAELPIEGTTETDVVAAMFGHRGAEHADQ